MFFASIHNHQLHKNLTLNAGIIFNYSSSNANSLEYNNHILDKQLGILIGAEYTWFQRKILSFSSSLALAYYRQYLSHNFQFESIHTSQPTFHINFAKFRVGRDLGGFIQLGYGIKGIVGIGIDCRLF